MAGLNNTPTARDMGYQPVKHVIVERITYLQENLVVDFKSAKLPANAMVVGGGVHVKTAFNDSGTDTLDVGFRGATTTDDPDAYCTLILLSAVGYIAFDELAAVTNIIQSKDATLTWRYNGENNNASAGEAFIVVEYVLPVVA